MADCSQKGVLERAQEEYEAALLAEQISDGIEEHRGESYMRNGRGAMIPLQVITPGQKLQDQTARRLIARAKAISRQVQAFRMTMLSDIDAFIDLQREHYGAKRGGAKGNVTLMSFDQLFKVERAVGEFIDFGPELETAKVLVGECLQDWTEGANAQLRAVVDRAFQVDKKGQIRRTQLLELLTLKMADERWDRAMQALKDSMRPDGTKRYVRCHFRAEPDAAWNHIVIDVAGQ